MGTFINTKVNDKEYLPLIIDFQDVILDIGFEYFQVIDNGKKFSIIGLPNVFDMGSKDLSVFDGKCVLIDNLWKQPIKDGSFTEIQRLFMNCLNQLDYEAVYAGTLALTSRSKDIAKILKLEDPVGEIFVAWKIADNFDAAKSSIDGFKLPKLSPTTSKTFTPKESEYDRLIARKKFIIEEYLRINGEESMAKFDTDLSKDFWELIKVILG